MRYVQTQHLRWRKPGIIAMVHIPHPLRQIVTIGILSILFLVLSACGPQSSSTTTGSGSGSTTATPTPTRTTTNGSVYGCPSDTVVSTAPTPANVIIRNADVNSPVTAHAGDTIDVRLPFGQKWSGPLSIPTNFQPEQPSGYAFTSDKVCIWRFVPQSAGIAHLDFYGQALCQKGTMCPMYIIEFSFTVDVK